MSRVWSLAEARARSKCSGATFGRMLAGPRSLDGFVQHHRIEVGPVGPYHGAEFGVHANPRELGGIVQRRKHAVERHVCGDVEVAFQSIVESKAQVVRSDDRTGNHVVEHVLTPVVESGAAALRVGRDPSPRSARQGDARPIR